MTRDGTLTLDGGRCRSTGTAWFDHQWGDFISVGGGGWDWFAVNLDDGTDLTLSLVRDADGELPAGLRHARRPGRDRRATSTGDAFTVEVTDRWTSPATGADYPAGWRSRIPGERLDDRRSRPTVAAQELDTRATTGVVYWEGSQVVQATAASVSRGRRGVRRADRVRRVLRRQLTGRAGVRERAARGLRRPRSRRLARRVPGVRARSLAIRLAASLYAGVSETDALRLACDESRIEA